MGVSETEEKPQENNAPPTTMRKIVQVQNSLNKLIHTVFIYMEKKKTGKYIYNF